ncbi:FHA domain-containing protein At4g14490 [Punica granatum]|nr:FHA domain-containing protein At4g14490 [Punica granatum]XP_031396436.1 FHA domain-containing protein At4g14490 [Punica granatum]XP_031396437.1 FHA domain-containing protein At4g14490 [Punica granatum]XP_031396438.1 FHA domain-containing protein At4g14490 [Punica granatum]XP_031396439.1 FHA domain-containing protein At4g14490 [Punica granatum]XP_031396440.1 FHA domain-containing protein At4g14490 [Punica granatum]XP_031396441.1 FHA domain-containing protein At4g14490 [Punica granatum]XP_0
MDAQPLKLHITKGPRAGETLEFRPGCRVRVGRVVRGNNVAIKDAGISSKHLSVDFDPESGKWVLQDLDSSNGSFLNDSSVSPGKPYFLGDADVVKIGESTSISVELNSAVVETKSRRGAKEVNDLKEDAKGSVLKCEIVDLDPEEGLGNTGASKVEVGPARVSPRRTRGRKKLEEKQLGFASVGAGASENQYGSECGEKKAVGGRRTRAGTRRIRNLDEQKQAGVLGNYAVKEMCPDLMESTEEVGVVNSGEENGDKENLFSKNLEEQHGLECQGKKAESKRAQAGSRRRKKLDEEKQMGIMEDVERLHTVEEARDEGREDKESAEILNLGKEYGNVKSDNGNVVGTLTGAEPNLGEGCSHVLDSRGTHVEARNKNICGVNESSREDGSLPDLTKMTLREWFDFMEAHLPKQIIDETEKMIAEMRTKAVRVREYVAEQKANKCKEPVR